MAYGDLNFLRGHGGSRTALTDDRTTSNINTAIQAGEAIVGGYGVGANFAHPIYNGNAEIGSDELVGIAEATSTETSSADGKVKYGAFIGGRSIIRGKATTSTNMDTQSELDGLIGDWVAFDVTAAAGENGDQTIDENEGSDPNVHCCKILDGDIVRGTLDVLIHANATEAAPLTGQTMDA